MKETGRKYVGEAGIDLGSNKVRELKVLVERQISRERTQTKHEHRCGNIPQLAF